MKPKGLHLIGALLAATCLNAAAPTPTQASSPASSATPKPPPPRARVFAPTGWGSPLSGYEGANTPQEEKPPPARKMLARRAVTVLLSLP